MIGRDAFVAIMDGLCDYWDGFGKFQDALEVNMDDNFLVRVFDTIMCALNEDVELDVDDDIGPLLYYYAFDCDWGRNDKAAEGLPIYESKNMSLTSADNLYNYLVFKRAME